MLSGKRTAAVLGVLLLAVAAFVATSSRAAHKAKGPQQSATPTPPQYQPPTIRLDSDSQVVTLCPDAESIANPRVRLKATGVSPEGKPLRYKWTVSGGRLDSSDGTDVVWDLTDAQPGVYNASVTVESGPVDNPLCTAFTSTKVVVRNCPPPRPVCPNVSIYCPDVQQAGATITVDTAGLAGQPITATVEVAGYNLECRAQCQASVPAPPNPTKFDEIGEVARDDEKARLDVFAIELQNSPGAQGYIIAYGGSGRRSATGQQRAQRARLPGHHARPRRLAHRHHRRRAAHGGLAPALARPGRRDPAPA